LARADVVLGVFVVAIEPEATLASDQHELIEAFAAQIALSIERERLREASAREKLLAASNRLHRTLLDSVSHELKTPLAVLRSAADGLSRESSPRTLVLAGEIRTATERLDRLVANLLHQTRLESGTISPHLVPCDIHDIVLGARKTIEEPLQGRTVEVDIPADPMLVMADAPLLEHALANLLHNAVLYTPLETPISISAVSEPSSARVAITVADRGPGIPAEVRAHPFQKFRRGNEARTGGLGLGLSIVHGLVVAQGGEIAVDDNPAGGARFTIRLPAVPCDEVPNE
jgi:two-component system sensor histidine kinase KdpD